MPNLSIIIPVYNAEKYLSECIDSIINQSYSDFEIILVNDGSTDNSKKVCESYSKKDSRIYFFDKENEGVSLTRNFGITKARGKYITFVDADDWLEKKSYENIISVLENDENIDIAIYNFNYFKNSKVENKSAPETLIFEDSDIIDLQATLLNPSYFKSTKYNIKFKGLAYPWNKIFKRDIVCKNNIKFRITNKRAIYEDLLFVYEYLKYVKKAYFFGEGIYNYRVFEESACNKYNGEIIDIDNELFNYLIDLDEKILKTESLRKSFHVRVINNFYISLNLYLYNKKNPDTFREKINKIKNILNNEIYKEAFKNVEFGLLSNNLKIVTILIRFRLFRLVYLYCELIKLIIKK